MFCYESSLDGFYEPRRASPDGCNINDDKTLNNLLRVSNFYRPDPKYLETKQEYCFTERMRCQLIDWMYGFSLDICEDGVLPHAVNLLDRYLSLQKVERPADELQVLGGTCLFIASKLREATPISVDSVVECGAYSYSIRDVRSWELRILNVLNWDTSAVLPHDLLDHFLHRLPVPDKVKSRVTFHARSLLNLSCLEYMFIQHSSKIMAAGCLYDAIFALGRQFLELREKVFQLLGEFIEIDEAEFECVVMKIRQVMENTRGGASQEIPPLSFSEKRTASPSSTSSTPTNIEELNT